jgi:hypothetical protein
VVIDRGLGVGLLITAGFVILLLPSGLIALGAYCHVVLVVYGALLLAGASVLLLAPRMVLPPSRWRFARWFASLTVDTRRVLLGPKGPMILGIACLLPRSQPPSFGRSGARRACCCRCQVRRSCSPS